MSREEIIEALRDERKTLEELQSELKLNNKKQLRRKLKNLIRERIIEFDGKYYFKKSAAEKKISTAAGEEMNYLPLILLTFIILLGFYLRIYHIDYPVIGYHNWKETRYLTPARNFLSDGFFKYGFFVPAYNLPPLTPTRNQDGVFIDFFPFSSIFAALSMGFFGLKLWAARLPVILFSMGAVVFMYLFAKRFFKREDFALLAAFLTSINPMFVFFSHNVDQMPFGLFFILGAYYFYAVWLDENKNKYLFLASLFVALSVVSKYTYIVSAVPLILMFPFRRLLKIKEDIGNITPYVAVLLILMIIPAWDIYAKHINSRYNLIQESAANLDKLTSLGNLFDPIFWKTMESYANDNYTMLGVLYMVLGLIAIAVTFNWGDTKWRFLFLSAITLISSIVILSGRLSGHSYHQYPIALFILLLITYFIITVGDFSKKLKVEGKGVPYINFVFIGLLLLLLLPNTKDSIDRQFDVQFYGLDIAGEYIKEHKLPGERLIHSTNQVYGILWHGDIMGTRGIPDTVEKIKYAEENLSARWLFIYQWDLQVNNGILTLIGDKARWDYFKNNYELKQFAFIQTQQGIQPVYMLFKKGGTYDETKLNSLMAGKPILYRDYELMKGKVRLSYINL